MPPWNNTETTQAAKRLAGKSLYTLGSGLCAAGVAAGKFAAAGVQAAVKAVSADHSGRERVTFVRLAEVEWRDSQGRHRRLPVALLGYEAGFQLWSLEGDGPAELLSIRRDGVVRCAGRRQGTCPAGRGVLGVRTVLEVFAPRPTCLGHTVSGL